MDTLKSNNPNSNIQALSVSTTPHTVARANANRLAFGLLILVLGGLYLANAWGVFGVNFIIDWSRLWPLTLVLIGLSLLRARPAQIAFVSALTLVFAAAAVFFIVLGGIQPHANDIAENNATIVTRTREAESAVVTLTSNINRLTLGAGTGDLARAYFERSTIQVDARSVMAGTRQEVTLEARQWRTLTTAPGAVDMTLNPDLPMSLNVNSGATSSYIDLTSTHIDNLSITSGAAAHTIVFGDVMTHVQAAIQTGASSIVLVVPRTVGVRLTVNGPIAQPAFVDFEPVDNQTYQSLGYNKAQRTLTIALRSGAATVSVVWR